MDELDIKTITNRSIRGIFSLTFGQIVNTLLLFLLTVFIDPRTFGVFMVVSAVLALLSYVSDIGLAAALVQKKEKITQEDLATTFTIQQLLVITLMVIGFLLTSFVASFYSLNILGIRLFQALLIGFYLASLKTIPSILLERNLKFQKLVLIQIIEALTFNFVALFLAVRGFGIESFTWAVLARGAIGVAGIYLVSPWKISLGISKKSAAKLLSFGVPFQANSVLALVKDDFLMIILGKILTFTQVGYIGFAQKAAFMPLRLVMDKVIRVTFPAFSRLQENSKYLSVAIEKTLFSIVSLVAPLVLGIVVLSPYAIRIIPKYTKWEEALPLIAFFAINALLSSVSTPLTNILNAIGKVGITFRLMVFWTVATWVLTFLLIKLVGFQGVAIASAVVATSVVLVVFLARRYIAFEVIRPVSRPFFASVVMATILYFVSSLLVRDIVTLVLAILLGGIIHFTSLFLLARKEIKADFQILLHHLRSSPS